MKRAELWRHSVARACELHTDQGYSANRRRAGRIVRREAAAPGERSESTGSNLLLIIAGDQKQDKNGMFYPFFRRQAGNPRPGRGGRKVRPHSNQIDSARADLRLAGTRLGESKLRINLPTRV